VFTQPTEKRKLGQMVLKYNEQRATTELYTKQYLQVRARSDFGTELDALWTQLWSQL
jgi:RNAse (barnase) inhibitor barstar